MKVEEDYLRLMYNVLKNGELRGDRTGTGTISLFGERLDIDLSEGFPLLTTKAMGIKSIISELLWFIKGSGNERDLAEIQHGTRDPSKKTIWSPNAEHTSGSKFKPSYTGDLGRVYGVQWRSWRGFQIVSYADHMSCAGGDVYFDAKVRVTEHDQLGNVIKQLRENPTDRRILLNAWNVGELDQMALPPCHMFAQFYLSNKNELSCQMYMRSCDVFLGLPYNIASYAALTHMIAKIIKSTPKRLIINIGDTHIYTNHVQQCNEQLERTIKLCSPELIINDRESIDDFVLSDFSLQNYESHPSISAVMAA
jgi:thymidylate synthase